jgi:predicted FMN-binding regulatory protein PaiB
MDIEEIQQQQSDYQQKMLNPQGEYIGSKWVSSQEKAEFIQGWNRAQEVQGQAQQQPTEQQVEQELSGLMDQARELRGDPVANRKALQEIDAKLARSTATLGQIRDQQSQPARQEAQQAHQGKIDTLAAEARDLTRDPVRNQQRIRQINAELRDLDRE